MSLPDRPCFRCGARGWCGHDGRAEGHEAALAVQDAQRRARLASVPATPLLIDQLAAAWGWTR